MLQCCLLILLWKLAYIFLFIEGWLLFKIQHFLITILLSIYISNNKRGSFKVNLAYGVTAPVGLHYPQSSAPYAVPVMSTSGKEVLWSKQMLLLARSRDASELWMSNFLFNKEKSAIIHPVSQLSPMNIKNSQYNTFSALFSSCCQLANVSLVLLRGHLPGLGSPSLRTIVRW